MKSVTINFNAVSEYVGSIDIILNQIKKHKLCQGLYWCYVRNVLDDMSEMMPYVISEMMYDILSDVLSKVIKNRLSEEYDQWNY